jgi:hypothetical protein
MTDRCGELLLALPHSTAAAVRWWSLQTGQGGDVVGVLGLEGQDAKTSWHDKRTKIRPEVTFTLTHTMPL